MNLGVAVRPICKSCLQITSCGTLCGQFQPFTSAQINPIPHVTTNLALALSLPRTRGRQGQSHGSAAWFGGVFPKKKRTAENPVSTNKSMRPTSYGRGVPLFFSEAFFSFLRSSLLLYRTQNTDWLREKNERMPNQMSNG